MRLCYIAFQIVPFLPIGCGFPVPFVFLCVSNRSGNSPAVGEKMGRKISPQKSKTAMNKLSFGKKSLHFLKTAKTFHGKISDKRSQKSHRNPTNDVSPIMDHEIQPRSPHQNWKKKKSPRETFGIEKEQRESE